MPQMRDATAVQLTPPGRGAVATIALAGAPSDIGAVDALFCPANGLPLQDQPVAHVVFGRWGREEPAEDIVVVRLDSRRAEIHCHAGAACIDRILSDLRGAGFETSGVPSRETPGSLPAAIAAAVRLAPTLRTATWILRQQRLWPTLLQRLSHVTMPAAAATMVEGVLAHEAFGRHLTDPWNIVIAGAPNSGKSTLMNALLGFGRSIVVDAPGTTRDVVSARTVFDGWPAVMSDTAGLRESADAIEQLGIVAAIERVQRADLCLLVTDLSQAGDPVPDRLLNATTTIRVGNKCDLVTGNAEVDAVVSALAGTGIDDLVDRIAVALVPAEPGPDQCIPFSPAIADWLRMARDACLASDLAQVRRMAGEFAGSCDSMTGG